MLTDLHIQNFRGIRELHLSGLQRVNLVVGRNNAGKTSLLEAASILVNPQSDSSHVARLRESWIPNVQPFQQGSFTRWMIYKDASEPTSHLRGTWDGQKRSVTIKPHGQADHVAVAVAPASRPDSGHPQVDTCAVSSYPMPSQNLVSSLGKAVLRRGGETAIECALREVDKRITKIRVDATANPGQVVVDVGMSQLIPLREMGQGIVRLVELFSEIIGAGAQLCVIDEMENGIHHSSLVDVWRGVAEAAESFDVQILATTHSYECIEAAHNAFSERDDYGLAVIQLFREFVGAQGRVLDRDHIQAGLDGNIDLRG